MDQKQQSQDELFNSIDVDGIEKNLITVDQSPEELEAVKEQIQLDGDKGDNKGAQDSAKEIVKPDDNKPDDKLESGKSDVIQIDEIKAAKTDEQEIKDKEKSGGTSKKEESSVHLHAASLQAKGVLPNFNLDDIKDLEPAEALDKIDNHIASEIRESVEAGINQYKQSLSPDAQDFLKALDEGIPFETVRDITSVKERYGSISEKDLKDNEELQKEILAESLRMKGHKEIAIKKYVEKAVQDNELFDDSKLGLTDINSTISDEEANARTLAKNEKLASETRNQKTKENITKAVEGVKEIFPGIPVTDAEKKKIETMMTVPVRIESRNGREIPISAAMELRAKDPIAFEMKLNYFINNGFFDGNSDLNKFAKKSETKAANLLINKLSGTQHKSGTSAVPKTKTETEKEKDEAFAFPTEMT